MVREVNLNVHPGFSLSDKKSMVIDIRVPRLFMCSSNTQINIMVHSMYVYRDVVV